MDLTHRQLATTDIDCKTDNIEEIVLELGHYGYVNLKFDTNLEKNSYCAVYLNQDIKHIYSGYNNTGYIMFAESEGYAVGVYVSLSYLRNFTINKTEGTISNGDKISLPSGVEDYYIYCEPSKANSEYTNYYFKTGEMSKANGVEFKTSITGINHNYYKPQFGFGYHTTYGSSGTEIYYSINKAFEIGGNGVDIDITKSKTSFIDKEGKEIKIVDNHCIPNGTSTVDLERFKMEIGDNQILTEANLGGVANTLELPIIKDWVNVEFVESEENIDL